jgi:hypothetical protein
MKIMNPNRLLPLVAVGVLALSATACGDDVPDGSSSVASTVAGGTVPSTVADDTVPPPGPVIDHPVGAGDLVMRIGYEGGFVPIEYTFLNLPTVLVTGDGRLIVQGGTPEIYPGPLLPNLLVRSIGEDGVQHLLALADEYGLLADREYGRPDNIADAPDTVVTISANGSTFRHSAYALGLASFDEAESDDARRQLAGFVDAVNEWLATSGDANGGQPYRADSYLIRATPVTDLSGFDVEPTFVEWFGSADLTVASECAEVPGSEYGELFASANQLTFFTVGEMVYSLTVKPLLPGDSC